MTETETPERTSLKGAALLVGALLVVLILVVVGLILLASDSGDTGGSGIGDANAESGFPVRSIDEILEGEFRVEVDPSGTSAVLHMSTTIDVACSVVYGATAQFGSLATDTDMAGGGHRIHQPLMAGLEPGTTVLWRVQGTAADGTVYVGDLEQFTTPTGEGSAARVNLALNGTVVETSSNFSESFAGANAIDGSLATEWSSRGDGDDAYIVIDLESPQPVTGIGFHTRSMTDGTSITNTFTVTIDGGAPLGPFDAGEGSAVADFEATGQVFRIDMASTTGGNTGAVEIEIYGS